MTETNKLQRILRDPLILPVYAPTLLLAFALGALTPILPIEAPALYVAEFSTLGRVEKKYV